MGLLPLDEAGRRIQLRRKEKGWTQAQLATHCGSVAQSLVSNWERGETPVSREHLPILCRALDLQESYLLVDDGPATMSTPAAG